MGQVNKYDGQWRSSYFNTLSFCKVCYVKCIIVVKFHTFSIRQTRQFFLNPSLFKCQKAVLISISKHLAIFIDVGTSPGLWFIVQIKIILAKSSKSLFDRPKSWRTIQINPLNVYFFFFVAIPKLTLSRNSQSIIWRKCNFSSSLFKASICGQGANVQQRWTHNRTM